MTQKRFLQIANFDEQMHYKDKNPIWIKLYCSLLDEYEFAQIRDETKFHAVGLMILAARMNNRLPDDEAWLRQKINANQEINLKLLLEIGFLEPVKNARKNRKSSFNDCKPKKTQGDVSRAVLKSGLAQNRTEQMKTEENTTEQTEKKRAAAADAGNVLCVDFSKSSQAESEDGKPSKKAAAHQSIYSLEECLRYVEHCAGRGDTIKNPRGLANHLFKTGEADSFIMATLYPKEQATLDREKYGEPVKFSAEPCAVCFGAKMADRDGKGYRACEHCKNERGKSTGLLMVNG